MRIEFIVIPLITFATALIIKFADDCRYYVITAFPVKTCTVIQIAFFVTSQIAVDWVWNYFENSIILRH